MESIADFAEIDHAIPTVLIHLTQFVYPRCNRWHRTANQRSLANLQASDIWPKSSRTGFGNVLTTSRQSPSQATSASSASSSLSAILVRQIEIYYFKYTILCMKSNPWMVGRVGWASSPILPQSPAITFPFALRVTSILPRVAFEYGQIVWALATRSSRLLLVDRRQYRVERGVDVEAVFVLVQLHRAVHA